MRYRIFLVRAGGLAKLASAISCGLTARIANLINGKRLFSRHVAEDGISTLINATCVLLLGLRKLSRAGSAAL